MERGRASSSILWLPAPAAAVALRGPAVRGRAPARALWLLGCLPLAACELEMCHVMSPCTFLNPTAE